MVVQVLDRATAVSVSRSASFAYAPSVTLKKTTLPTNPQIKIAKRNCKKKDKQDKCDCIELII